MNEEQGQHLHATSRTEMSFATFLSHFNSNLWYAGVGQVLSRLCCDILLWLAVFAPRKLLLDLLVGLMTNLLLIPIELIREIRDVCIWSFMIDVFGSLCANILFGHIMNLFRCFGWHILLGLQWEVEERIAQRFIFVVFRWFLINILVRLGVSLHMGFVLLLLVRSE